VSDLMMKLLDAGTMRLKLDTGAEVRVFVHAAAHGTSRPKCLLLHGNPGSLFDWEHIASRLTSVADMAAMDMPGFGTSRRLGSDPKLLGLDRLAAHVIATLDALAWGEPVLLVGHSHGGGVAQIAAARYPRRIAGIVLIGSLGSPAHASYRLLSQPGAATIAAAAGRLFGSTTLRPISRRILSRVMRDIFFPEPLPPGRLEHELSAFSARPEVLLSMVQVALGDPCEQLMRSAPSIQCPTWFIHGERDILVPPAHAKRIHDRIRQAGGRSQFQLIPNAGHMLIHFQASQIADSIVAALSTV
jgi:pyruvate dehydrogenase E2 component (dihydrolipoamide acetyltransferase)